MATCARAASIFCFTFASSGSERISRRLAFLDVQIEAGDLEYDQAKAHLDDCLTLAGNCHKLYMSLDDSLRRTCN